MPRATDVFFHNFATCRRYSDIRSRCPSDTPRLQNCTTHVRVPNGFTHPRIWNHPGELRSIHACLIPLYSVHIRHRSLHSSFTSCVLFPAPIARRWFGKLFAAAVAAWGTASAGRHYTLVAGGRSAAGGARSAGSAAPCGAGEEIEQKISPEPQVLARTGPR